MKIKQRFPDEQSLKNEISEQLARIVQTVQADVGHLEKQYKNARRSNTYGFLLIITAFVIFWIVQLTSLAPWTDICLNIIAVLMIIYGAYAMLKANDIIKAFNASLNATLFPLAVGIFGLKATYFNNLKQEELRSKVDEGHLVKKFSWKKIKKFKDPFLKELDESQLITEARNTVHKEDSMLIDVREKKLFVQELDVKHVTRRGKHSHTKNIFKGYFVSFELPRPLEHKTFVSTEGDKNGFGHKSFWSGAQTEKLEKTELEWNDFEEKLHVMTTSPTEARYILTPSFMQDLYTWWQEKHENIRISFIDNKLSLLFPNKKIKMGKTIPELSEEEIREYVESIAIPLLHVLHLVEDVEDGF